MARNVKTVSVCLPETVLTWTQHRAMQLGISTSSFVSLVLSEEYARQKDVYATVKEESTNAQSAEA